MSPWEWGETGPEPQRELCWPAPDDGCEAGDGGLFVEPDPCRFGSFHVGYVPGCTVCHLSRCISCWPLRWEELDFMGEE